MSIGDRSAAHEVRSRIRTVSPGLFPLAVCAALLYRAHAVGAFTAQWTGGYAIAFTQTILNDAPLIAAMLALNAASFHRMSGLGGRVVMRLAAIAIALVYVADIYVLEEFATRLIPEDVFRLWRYAPVHLARVHGVAYVSAVAAIAALFVAAYVMNSESVKLRSKRSAFLIAPVVVFGLAGFFAAPERYVHSWRYNNIASNAITTSGAARQYSEQFRTAPEPVPECLDVPSLRRDVIVLLLESYSNYQSAFFSGINDWTPNLDRVARSGLAFRNHHANGFDTADGEITTLLGELPIKKPSKELQLHFDGFNEPSLSVPAMYRAVGYETRFLTSAELSFANTGEWARDIGFAYQEGAEWPGYEGKPRYLFNAVSDDVLFARVVSKVREQKELGTPFFFFVKSVSSHHPPVHPKTRERSEAAVWAFVDQAFGEFYDDLAAAGFFENGILVVFGDHHSMLPERPAETAKYGYGRAAAMVPLFYVGAGFSPAVDDRYFQQTDVARGLAGMLSGRLCIEAHEGFIHPDRRIPPRMVLFRRGERRNVVSVFTLSSEYSILLAGDDTRVEHVAGSKDESLAREALQTVNRLRVVKQIGVPQRHP